MDKQKVLVTGYVDRRKVLKVVRRTGRRAEFWPFPYDSEYHPYASQYLEDSSYSSTYNYYRHGYNSTVQGYFPNPAYSTIVDDRSFFHCHLKYFKSNSKERCAVLNFIKRNAYMIVDTLLEIMFKKYFVAPCKMGYI